MAERKVQPTDAHRAFRDEMLAVMRKHGSHLEAPELLAIASHMVGQLVALQDQRTMTPDRAMKIVAANIEQGNQEVLDGLAHPKGAA